MNSDSYGRFFLEPVQSRTRKFMMILGIAIAWNSLIGGVIYLVLKQWKTHPMYFFAVILFVFGLIGLFLIYASGYQLISLFGPRPKVSTSSNQLRFGGRVDLDWAFTMPHLVQNLEIWLEPDEEEQEASTRNQKACVYSVSDNLSAGRGQASIQLPEKSARPYIQSRKINYLLQLKARVKYLPDVDMEYSLEIS